MTHAELRGLCEDIEINTQQYGAISAVLVQAVVKAVPALLDELERVYQVMGRSAFLSVADNINLYHVFGKGWNISAAGSAVTDEQGELRHEPLQAALQRAWELERGT